MNSQKVQGNFMGNGEEIGTCRRAPLHFDAGLTEDLARNRLSAREVRGWDRLGIIDYDRESQQQVCCALEEHAAIVGLAGAYLDAPAVVCQSPPSHARGRDIPGAAASNQRR